MFVSVMLNLCLDRETSVFDEAISQVQCFNQRENKQVGKSEHQSILAVLTHSCYHIKGNLSKQGGFPDPRYCFGENPTGVYFTLANCTRVLTLFSHSSMHAVRVIYSIC